MAIPPPPQDDGIDFYIETEGTPLKEHLRIDKTEGIKCIRSRSLGFRKLIDRVWPTGTRKVVISTHDDAGAIKSVLTNLQRDVALLAKDPSDPKWLDMLAQQCNVLWQYECDPEPYEEMWKQSRSQLADIPSSEAQEQSDSHSRCWHHTQNTSVNASRFVIALVLGVQHDLIREVDIIWRSPSEVKTPALPDRVVEGKSSSTGSNNRPKAN